MSYYNGQRIEDEFPEKEQPRKPTPLPASVEQKAEAASELYKSAELSTYNNRVQENGKEDFKAGFIAGATSQSLPLSIVEQLRKENPYTGEINFTEDKRIGWNNCCDELESILREQGGGEEDKLKNALQKIHKIIIGGTDGSIPSNRLVTLIDLELAKVL